MKFSNILLAGVAAIALVSCGKKDEAGDAPRSETSREAARADAGSPLDKRFVRSGTAAVPESFFLESPSPHEVAINKRPMMDVFVVLISID